MKLYHVLIVNSLDGEEREISIKARSLNHVRCILDNSNIMTMFEYVANICEDGE